MLPKMRIVFMGTPEFAVPALIALIEAGHKVVAVYTQPPRPAGRGKQLQPSPVQREAQARGIMVRYPTALKGADEQAEFAALGADIAIVAAYGLILPQAVLDAPKHGCLNIHASLLPRWRGAAPIQRAILAGDDVTGVTIMRMERGLDTGPMLAVAQTPVDCKTAGELTAELSELGGRLMVEVLVNLSAHAEMPQPYAGVTYAAKIDKAEARINFGQGAQQVERQMRAFAPVPGAFFELEGERIRVLSAVIVRRPDQAKDDAGLTLDDTLTIACGQDAIRPTLIQRAGRPVMETASFLRGRAIPMGTQIR